MKTFSRDKSKKVTDAVGVFVHAAQQAKRIEDYWAARGQTVRAWVETQQVRFKREDGTEDVRSNYAVRSDMVNGLPGRRVVAEAA